MLSFSSCEKENQALVPEDGAKMTLTASIEQPTAPSTKTSLGETVGENTPVLWDLYNRIKVYTSKLQLDFRVMSIDNESQTAIFKKAYLNDPDITSAITSAIYPADMGTTTENQITIPATQDYITKNLDDNTLPMYAQVKDGSTSLEFKQLCGIVKIQLTGIYTQEVKIIEFISDDYIAGTATITYNDGQPTLAFTENMSKTITLNCGDAGVYLYSVPRVFPIVVPPTTANTFTIKVTLTNGDVMTKTAPANDANKINRAKIKTMDEIVFEKDRVILNYIENGKDRGKGILIGETVWAPVNCGYQPAGEEGEGHKGYPYGKLYQWGRKYGQGYDANDATYPSDANIVQGPVSNEVGNKEENKDKFYKNNTGDWCSPQLREWSSANDPCPEGWRVPTESEIRKLQAKYSNWTTSDGQSGRWFSGDKSYSSAGDAKVFFPAAGYLLYYGLADYRGSNGFYWSSSVNGARAYYLSFGSGDVSMYSIDRAYGKSVRCVEDL